MPSVSQAATTVSFAPSVAPVMPPKDAAEAATAPVTKTPAASPTKILVLMVLSFRSGGFAGRRMPVRHGQLCHPSGRAPITIVPNYHTLTHHTTIGQLPA